MLVKMLSPSIMLKRRKLIVGLGFLVISLSLDSSFARAGSSFDRLLQAVVRIDVRETTFEVPLEQSPKPVRQADRKYFEDTGLTIREFVVYDNVSLKLDLELDEIPGVIVSFVKPNSNAQTGGSQNGDLIKEIDGVAIRDFDQAVSMMEELESNDSKNDFVMLVARGAETSVLRITLD